MVPESQITRSLVVKSKPSAVIKVRKWVLSRLEADNFSQKDIFAVHLAIEEAFINAVKHGNKMDAAKDVKIECSVGLDKVEISIIDEGGGFEPNLVPDPRYGKNLYKLGGRGLFLMRSYMDVVKFNESGNSVYMLRYRQD